MCSITEVNSPDASLLSDAISKYRRHLEDNPRYLDTLMVSGTETSLQQIVAQWCLNAKVDKISISLNY